MCSNSYLIFKKYKAVVQCALVAQQESPGGEKKTQT